MNLVSVVLRVRPDTADADVVAAFRNGGEITSIRASSYQFEWRPIVAGFEGQADATPESSSTLVRTGALWRWQFDSYALSAGPVLRRTANALRLLALLEHVGRRISCVGWSIDYEGVFLAANEAPGGAGEILITSKFTELIAGDAGHLIYTALRRHLCDAVGREDLRTRDSERSSSLIASFVTDQLAVRAPISEAEIDGLKRSLGLL